MVMRKYRYTIHMMCGGEAIIVSRRKPKAFMSMLMRKKEDEYVICEESEGRDIIIMKQQIEYVEAERI